MTECKKRSDWNKWKEAIQAELNSLKKRKVFTEVIPNISGNTKASIFAVDGCRDCIFI
jgi:hypothetical protein